MFLHMRFLCSTIAVALITSAAYAKNVDFSGFEAACPKMAPSLLAVEKQLNGLRLSDKDFLRIQLKSFQKLSQMKAAGRECLKIKTFFAEQTVATRAALRQRAATANARAAQMTVELNRFTADMQTLQAVIGAVVTASAGANAQSAPSNTFVPKANKCVKRASNGGLTNRCSYPIVVAFCTQKPSKMDECSGSNSVTDGLWIAASGGRIKPKETVNLFIGGAAQRSTGLSFAACDARPSRLNQGIAVRLNFHGETVKAFSCSL